MDDYAGRGVPTFGPPIKDLYCECEHPESSHDEAGCTWLKTDESGVDWTCSCLQFTEAQGDTLASLGVDVL